jgi:transposase
MIRYKHLALVERDFRTSKTVELDMRPIRVRLESSTRGLVLVVMSRVGSTNKNLK